jgi:hypothetical protein
MPRRAVQLRSRVGLVERSHVQRVKRMQVQDRLDLRAVARQLADPASGVVGERAGIDDAQR